jgi:hypothetical protein
MSTHEDCRCLDRRDLLKLGAAGLTWGLFGLSLPKILFLREAYGITPQAPLYDAAIQIFYDGGPSQTDTWDPKPGSPNNVFPTIDLGANDKYGKPIKVSDQLPNITNLVQSDRNIGLGLFRSMVHGNADHGTAQSYMNCFWEGALASQYSSTAAVMAYYFQGQGLGIPSVLIAGGNGNQPNDAKGNPIPTALMVNVGQNQANNPTVQALGMPQGVTAPRYARRAALLEKLNEKFLGSRPDDTVKAWDKAWKDARDITTKGEAAKAFDLTGKTILPPGRNVGEAMNLTLAQELVKAGIPYVAVGIGGNDSHSGNMATIRNNWGAITDQAVARMAKNLEATGKRVLILMGGEFGRTPDTVASGRDGRDHFPDGFSWAMVSVNQPRFKTGAWGDTGPDGMWTLRAGNLVDPTHPRDVGALLYRSLGFDIGHDVAFDVPMNGRPGAPPVDRVNDSDALMKYFGLA